MSNKAKSVSMNSNIKNVKQMMNSILGPQESNRHIYFGKIFKIHDHLIKCQRLYESVSKSLGLQVRKPILLSEQDDAIMRKIDSID